MFGKMLKIRIMGAGKKLTTANINSRFNRSKTAINNKTRQVLNLSGLLF